MTGVCACACPCRRRSRRLCCNIDKEFISNHGCCRVTEGPRCTAAWPQGKWLCTGSHLPPPPHATPTTPSSVSSPSRDKAPEDHTGSSMLSQNLELFKQKKKKEEISKGVRGYACFYFFLPLVPVGVVGRYSCQSAARRVAWRRDIPWVLSVSATELLHCFLGLPLALQPEYLVLFARKAGWFMGMLPWKFSF